MKAVFIVLIFFSGVVIGGTVFTVNSIGDSPDASLNNNCYTGSTIGGQPECTLRAAIQESNNTSGASIDFNI
ncbi:MAG TPA: CSLREA domain-containing protein, partial [Gammaproteobacteria bacterium]|nr:CSLREA domain-containing protein [Gammaproteobacteria bacterium]